MKSFPSILALLLPALVHGGQVRTLDGKNHEGEVRLEKAGELTIISPGAPPLKVPLENLLSATFKPTAPPGQARITPRWLNRDVGNPAAAGSARIVGDTVTFKASGMGIAAAEDQFHFLHQPLAGDGQIIVRIAAIQKTHRQASAGVMFRASLDPKAPFAAALLTAAEGLAFQSRPRPGANPRIVRGKADLPPSWVRLAREGDLLSAYESDDGQEWRLIDSETLKLPHQAFVGVVVWPASKTALAAATVERIAVTAGTVAAEPPMRGVILRGGSLITGEARGIDDSTVRLLRPREREVVIPRAEVARILFGALPREQAAWIQAGPAGVLLASGDFFQGDVVATETGRIAVSSILFGERQFEQARVRAAILRQPDPARAAYEVRVADGSILHSDRIHIDKDKLSVLTPGGTLVFPAAEIIEIRAGGSRFQSLLDGRPLSIDAPAGALGPAHTIDGTTAGVPMVLGGQSFERGLGLAGGASVSYQIHGEYRFLLVTMGVPRGVLPAAEASFVILGDDRELYRSAGRTSLDEPLSATIQVGDVKRLILKVESQPGALGACGLFAEPALVR